MTTVNFIPAHRVDRKARRRRRRGWTAGSVAFGVVLLVAWLSCRALWGLDPSALLAEMDKARTSARQSAQAIGAAGPQLAAAETTLAMNRAVGNQPDWSGLLVLLAKSLDDDVVLRQCQMKADLPSGGPLGAPAPGPPESGAPLLLSLAGFGRTQAAVSQFALRLEQLGLFDQVRLLRTSREPFLSDSLIAFEIECLLGGKGGSGK